ncbi:hypothetical protein KIW74_gp53 [Mycobacterium phage Kimona]|uniref:Uncharacterized protein n=1 Tax=Mycobacterium phage Kimona TaxID=2024295 RepID=A0A249XU12_9CAUD|nr:hypothetical protein KIW74_gp53 [Mycobacterium phage Kimona]ASZ75475.1 hypothetical protein PBI_KIMONA_39 [Mycobacterium phage Kimona]
MPWFPKYYVEVCDSDSESFITNSVMLRISTRVKREELDDVLRRLLPEQDELEALRRELTVGRS